MKAHRNDMERISILTAKDLMTKPPISLEPTMGAREAASLLLDSGVHGAPVVEKDGRVVGVLSMTDLTRWERERGGSVQRESDWYRTAREARDQDVNLERGFHVEAMDEASVREIMSPFVISVYENANLADVVSILLRNRIHRLIVVKEPGPKLVGVVSETDVLVAIYAALSPEEVKAVL